MNHTHPDERLRSDADDMRARAREKGYTITDADIALVQRDIARTKTFHNGLKMDYRELCRKYIRHVESCEGIHFLTRLPPFYKNIDEDKWDLTALESTHLCLLYEGELDEPAPRRRANSV